MSLLVAWLKAVGAFSFTATIIPVSLAAVIAYRGGAHADWILFPFILLGGLFINAASDLTNEYYDHKLGVDGPASSGRSHVLIEGSLKPRHILIASTIFYSLAAIMSVYFIYLRGIWMAILIFAGLIAGFTYTSGKHGYKYYALGEPMCFLFYGPLMSFSSYLALTGELSAASALAAVPMGFLVAAILNGNNMRDIDSDRRSSIRTLPMMLGHDRAKALYSAMILSAYISIFPLVYFGILPQGSLVTLGMLPMGLYLISIAYGADRARLRAIDISTAKLHLLFGTILLLSFFL